jgi:hypothetical protein
MFSLNVKEGTNTKKKWKRKNSKFKCFKEKEEECYRKLNS